MARYLPQIVSNALPATTILLADGTYTMGGGEGDRRMIFAVPRVTMRSASGDRDKVIIDGQYWTHEIVYIAADNVTIADITLKRAIDHLVHVVGGKATVNGTLLYNSQPFVTEIDALHAGESREISGNIFWATLSTTPTHCVSTLTFDDVVLDEWTYSF